MYWLLVTLKLPKPVPFKSEFVGHFSGGGTVAWLIVFFVSAARDVVEGDALSCEDQSGKLRLWHVVREE